MAEPDDSILPAPPGLLATVTAAVAAALTVGLLFGVFDALLAGFPLLLSEGQTSFAFGCLAASVMTYSVAATIVLVLVAAGLHPILRRYCEKKRLRRLLLLGGWLAIWIELSLGLTPDPVPAGWIALGSQGLVALLGGVLLARLLVRLPVGVHAALRTLAVIAIAGGLYFVQGEGRDEGARGFVDERDRELFNVLFLVADRLPVTELSCYGGAGETPNLDGLAERGVLIEACYAPSPIPEVNLAVIATGGVPSAAWWVDSLPALLLGARTDEGRELAAGAYATNWFLNTTIPPTTAGIRGIECEEHEALLHCLAPGELGWESFRADLRWQILEDRILRGATADPTVRHARAWLPRMEGRRWMAHVVLRGESGAEAVDAAVGELLELLEELDAVEETLVILTAAQGEKPDPANPLSASSLHVPLLLANTRLLPHGGRYGGIVEGEDVVPTVIDLLDLELSNEHAGLEGHSFLPGILGTQRGEVDEFRPKRFAFAAGDTQLSILDGKSQLIASRKLFDRDTLPEADDLPALLEEGTSLRSIDLAAGADEASRAELAVVRTLWSELRRFQTTLPERTRDRSGGFPEGPDPGRAEENDE